MTVSPKARRTKQRRIEDLQRRLDVWTKKQELYRSVIPESAQRAITLDFISEQISKTQKELTRLLKL